MAKIISIANQKGGVGKTTTAINLSAALVNLDKRVLIIDMDPQGNSSRGVGIDINALNKTLYDALVNACDVNKAIKHTSIAHLDVLPSNLNLANFSAVINNVKDNPYLVLKDIISQISEPYDFIFIDCPPSLGLLTINALSASNSILIPVQCEYFAMEALAQILGTISEVKRLHNPNLAIEGFVLTMFDTQTNLSKEIAQEVRLLFKENTFISVIPRNVSIPEATAKLMPVSEYRPTSAGSLSYAALAKELLDHESQKN
ncbi:MAG: AAA family ATPase [Bacilli bacterium]|nr:AAA family ATPase [Bacilli bacterium]